MAEFKNVRLIFILMLFFVVSCALQLPPEGGEVDLIPPEIVSTFPISGTVNYSEKYFEIEFSEYVDKRSFREALFISPVIDGEMEIDWSGKTAEVYFPNGLKENTTYVITIGTDVVDLNNNNRMANALSLYFSTGNKIDTKEIFGKVYDKNADGIMMFTYKYETDTTNYLAKKSDYISQCGKDGQFVIKGLPEGKFRVFAVKDQFRDLIFQAEQDEIGIPSQDIYLSENDSSFTGLNFYLTKIDTLPPRVLDVKMLDQYHIYLKFSEELNSELLKNQSFQIVDTTSRLISNIQYFFIPPDKRSELVLIPEQKINTDTDFFLNINNLEDNNGNILSNEQTSFFTTDKIDTNAIKILKIEPSDFRLDYIDASINIFFDDAFQKNKIDEAIEFLDQIISKVPFDLSFIDDASIKIKPLQRLKLDSRYNLVLKMNLLPDAAENVADTIITLNFVTKNEFEFSGLCGKINSDKENLILVLESENNSELKNYFNLNSKKEFEFSRIIPGKHKLWAFEDTNKNSQYDFGKLNPFEFSENFYVFPEIIEIKPRWSLTDLIFDIK